MTRSASIDRNTRLFAALGLALSLLAAQSAPGGEGDAQTPAQMKPYEQAIPGSPVKFKLTPIPAGEFKMGSPAGEATRKADEGPQVIVKIEPFWMGVHEVTWDEMDLFIKEYDIRTTHFKLVPKEKEADAVSFPTPIYEKGLDILGRWGRNGGFPAADMTQFCAKQYTKWLSKKTGRFHRLPTEAEWEYAARAGTTTAYFFGDDPKALGDYAWFLDNSFDEDLLEERYSKVGQKKPNPWGLYDIYGNVAEWTFDQYDAKQYEKLASKSPVSASDAIHWATKDFPHSIRGGSWFHEAPMLRSAARLPSFEAMKKQDPQEPKSIWWPTDAFWVGFRVVRPLVEPSAEEQAKYWEPDTEDIRHVLKADRKQLRGLVEE